MSRKSIPLLCYLDGKISRGTQDITFEDATLKATRVNRGIKYSEMVDKIYELVEIDREKYKLKIVCRYLANGLYVALTIDNDESVDMTKEKGINRVELYIEKSATAGDEGENPTTTKGSSESAGDEGEEPKRTEDSSENIHLNVKTRVGKERVYRMKCDMQLHVLMKTVCEGHQLCYKENRFYFSDVVLREWTSPNEDGNNTPCRMKPDTPVWKLKTAFSERQQWSIDDIRFIYGGRQLEDGRNINEYDIHDDSVIHAVKRLRGD